MTELPEEWVDDPPSDEIADILNAAGAECCPHDRIMCWSQCGVLRTSGGWATFTEPERRQLLGYYYPVHRVTQEA